MKEEDIINILKENSIGFDDGYGGSHIAVSEDMFTDVAQQIMKLLEGPPYLISNK